jgi:hypothetical protein
LNKKIKIEIKERPMFHDNNAFKKTNSRPNSSKNFTRSCTLKTIKIYNSPICKDKKDIKNKIFQTTKEDPFIHNNFTEIPD